jgi:hypothetical protein
VHLGQFEAAPLALWYRGVFLVVVSHLSTYVTMGATRCRLLSLRGIGPGLCVL